MCAQANTCSLKKERQRQKKGGKVTRFTSQVQEKPNNESISLHSSSIIHLMINDTSMAPQLKNAIILKYLNEVT